MKELDILLANLNVLYVKLHTLHYNIVGPEFPVVHPFLEGEYDKVHDMIDEVAELSKINGFPVLTTMTKMLEVATIEETDQETYTSAEVLQMVTKDYTTILENVQAVSVDSKIVETTLDDMESNLQKGLWILKATLA